MTNFQQNILTAQYGMQCYSYKQDDSNNHYYNPIVSASSSHEGRSHNAIPLQGDIKKNSNNSMRIDDDKSFTKSPIDLTWQKQPIVVKNHTSQIPFELNKKVKSGRAEIIVYYFNTTRKIVFSKTQIEKKFALYGEQSQLKQMALVKYLIPFLVKQYCQLFLNFQPLEVYYEYFQLKLAGLNCQDDPMIEPYQHQQSIIWLFDSGNLLLVRKQRSYEKLNVLQQNISPEMQVLQIIIPFQRQIIQQQIQKNKNLSSLKQKLMSYHPHGNIAIVTYNNLTVCEFKKKISQIVAMDRILQVYRIDAANYEDVSVTQKQKQKNQLMKQQPILQQKQSRTITNAEFEVNQNFYSGKLYVQILGTKIIQKYEGGIVSYIVANERRIQRSILTLIGISCEKTTIKMKFITKDGAETCIYQFQNKINVQNFFKCILRIGRQLKQNFQKISQ